MGTDAHDDETPPRNTAPDADEEREPGVPPHQPAPGEDGDRVDEGAEESFPSSDPPATGGPGI